jgi:hypothetical protein
MLTKPMTGANMTWVHLTQKYIKQLELANAQPRDIGGIMMGVLIKVTQGMGYDRERFIAECVKSWDMYVKAGD